MLKKLALIMLMLGMLVACSTEDDNADSDPTSQSVTNSVETESQLSFQATILENEGTLFVKPVAGESELRSADKISVSTKDAVLMNDVGKEISKEDFQPGEMIEIIYDGMIAESYPAQIHHTYNIKIITDDE